MGQEKSIQRLSGNQLHNLNPNIQIPQYDRSQIKTGIVHIGPSAFFRGHLALYIDDLMNQGEQDWGICAVSLKSSGVRDALQAQDNLYTVVERSLNGNSTARVVGSITDVMVAPENPQAVLDRMASPDIKLVTLTVTQDGYYYKNGQLDFDDDDIKADLMRADEPTSTVGYIVKALEMRMERGLPAFTVMSCDNLTGNGTVLRNVVLAYAAQRSPQLRDWIADKVSFPSTMVDRIVPKTLPQHVEAYEQDYDAHDEWPIYTESFRQFVIENPRNGEPLPNFKQAGALQIDDVTPFELMKIRLLNGTHMVLGMVGRMAGYTYAHEAINDPHIREYVKGFMEEMTATLHPVPGVDLDEYKAKIFERLDSPFMMDQLERLARKGIEKVDTRFLQGLRDATSQKTPSNHITFAVATWIEYLKRSGPDFNILDDDAVKKGLTDEARKGGATPALLASHPEIFGADISSSATVSKGIERHLKAICQSPADIVKALPAAQTEEAPRRSRKPAEPGPTNP